MAHVQNMTANPVDAFVIVAMMGHGSKSSISPLQIYVTVGATVRR